MLSVRRLIRRTTSTQGPHLGPLDLEAPAGQVVVVMGPSGSGKSLLLRAIADLDPAEGEVSLDEVPRETLDAPAWRRRVVHVAAEAGWWDDVVGPHFADRATAAALLPRLGLPAEALDWPVARLSTGERQRLAVARALTLPRPAGAARAYLLDEPTAALDTDSARRLEEIIAGLLDARTAVVLVTHDPAQARRLATAGIFMLRDGALVAREDAA